VTEPPTSTRPGHPSASRSNGDSFRHRNGRDTEFFATVGPAVTSHGRRNRSGRPDGCQANNLTNRNFYIHIISIFVNVMLNPGRSFSLVIAFSVIYRLFYYRSGRDALGCGRLAVTEHNIGLCSDQLFNYKNTTTQLHKNTSRKMQLILRKISKFDATRCKILRRKCTKLDFRWDSAPDPARGAYSAPPDPLAIGADFHREMVATAPGEQLLIGRRLVKNWTRRSISSWFLCRK